MPSPEQTTSTQTQAGGSIARRNGQRNRGLFFVLSVIAAAGLVLFMGCSRTVSRLSAQPASWSYVRAAWGGITLGSTSISDRDLVLQLAFAGHGTRVDSAACAEAAPAKVEGSLILVHLNPLLCDASVNTSYRAHLTKPPKGHYQVAYDDQTAHDPAIGAVTVE
jgi:hypothetical protein